MWPFDRSDTPTAALQKRVDELETALQQLQLDTRERQLTVLTTVDKVLHQLRARHKKRERDADDAQDEIEHEAEPVRRAFNFPNSRRGF